ncbi:MAG: hypothetical protein U0414_32975 [Polyangiaceae bacterium]
MIQRLLKWCDSPRFPWVLAAIAFALTLPSLSAGAFLDDRFHEHALLGHSVAGGPRGVWDLYRFSDGGAGLAAARDQGAFPWWTNPDLKLGFFRPIASLWLALDHVIWKGVPWGPHLETALLYAALAYVTARAFGALVGGAAGGLAALFFVLEDGHAVALAWTANRYALVAALFSFATLGAFVRARDAGRSSLPSAALLILALLGGEVSLGVVGYLFAYALFKDPAGRRAGLLALVPHALVVVAWVVTYQLLGFGARGSSLYIDPASTPVRFLLAAIQRGPILLLAQMFGPPAEISPNLPPQAQMGLAIVGVLLGGAVVYGVARLAKGHPATRVLLVGALFALGPGCAMQPDDRLLMIAGFGAFGAIAIAIHAVATAPAKARTVGARVFTGTLAFVHLVVAGLLLPAKQLFFPRVFQGVVALGAKTLPLEGEVADTNIVVLGVPDALIGGYMLLERLLDGSPLPKRVGFASVQTNGSYDVERTAVDTIEIDNPLGMNASPFSAVFRDHAYAVGEKDQGSGFVVEVLEVLPTGIPSRVRLVFTDPPETWRFAVWSDAGFVEVPILAVGERRTWEGVDLMTAGQRANAKANP